MRVYPQSVLIRTGMPLRHWRNIGIGYLWGVRKLYPEWQKPSSVRIKQADRDLAGSQAK